MNHDSRDDGAVIVFVRAPVKGTVKTRLAKTVGESAALELYRCFVADILAMLSAGDRPRRIYFHPAGAEDQVRAWLGNEADLFAQCEGSLGEKMKSALAETFAAGFGRAVLIGSDSPQLAPEVIEGALQTLRDRPAVIGPSRDGGYYLIGFSATGFLPPVFDHISWGTNRVFDRTLAVFLSCGLDPFRLPVRLDIDTGRDLAALAADCRNTPRIAARTMACLRRNHPDMFTQP